MRIRLSLRMRLLLCLWLVLILALFLPSFYYSRSLSDDVLVEARKEAVSRLDIVHWLLMDHSGFQDAEQLQQWLTLAAGKVDARLTYVVDGGRVIADSGVAFDNLGNLDNHATRPEIIEARSQEVGMSIRYSATLHVDLLYAAKSIKGPGNIPPGVLRVAIPFSRMKERLGRLKTIHEGVLALTLLATTFLVFAFSRQLNRSVRTIMRAAEAIGKGDFKKRVHFYPGQEYFPLAFSINQMAESIESHVQVITSQKQQLEAILNGMQEAVMLLDSRGRIHAVNKAFKKMAAGTPQVVGRRPLEVIRSTELQEACDLVTARDAIKTALSRSLQVVRDEEHTYDVNVVRVRNDQGRHGAIVVFHDISEIKRLEKVRRDFVTNVSHELRTPLTSIKGYAETLLSEPKLDPDAVRSSLQVILGKADHMAKMAGDLLDLARLEAPELVVDRQPVNAIEVVEAAWSACSSSADAKGIQLKNDLPEGGLLVSADFDQLVQVFKNLMDNAIKYSPSEGKIVVSGTTLGGMVKFGLRDEGPGIPKHEQKRIFERFYRVEKHRAGQAGSTGLGLAVCRHIIRNHGGDIWAESPPPDGGKGSAIFFTLVSADASQQAVG